MKRVISILVNLVWGLWFGGLIVLFIAVVTIFRSFPDRHDVAGQAAGHIFHAFNGYQLVLACVALILTFIWRVMGPGKRKSWLFAFLAIATVGACVITLYCVPHIEMLQQQGLTQSTQFSRMHRMANHVYLAEAIALLIAGVLLPRE